MSCILQFEISNFFFKYFGNGDFSSNSSLLLYVIFLQNRRLLVIATSSNRSFLRELGLLSAFSRIIDVPALSAIEHIMAVIEDTNALSPDECNYIQRELSKNVKE